MRTRDGAPRLRRTVKSVLLAVALAAGVGAVPTGADRAAMAAVGTAHSFTVTWSAHPVHETGTVDGSEWATLRNTGTTRLSLLSSGWEDDVVPARPSACVLEPGGSCLISVGTVIVGGDYPRTWTRTLVVTMAAPDGTAITRRQPITLAMVDDPPGEPFSVRIMGAVSAEQPTLRYCAPFSMGGPARVREPVTLVSLTSDRYGNMLDPANPRLSSDGSRNGCQRSWTAKATVPPAPYYTDMVRMGYVDDEGNRGSAEFPLSWPGPVPAQLRLAATLTADRTSLAETGDTPTYGLTLRNLGNVPLRPHEMTTRDGRDLLAELRAGTLRCDGLTGSGYLSEGATAVCRFAPAQPLTGRPGTTYEQAVRLRVGGLVGDGEVTADPGVAVAFRDVPPDARVTLAGPDRVTPGRPSAVAVVVTGTSAEAGTVVGIDADVRGTDRSVDRGVARVASTTCTPGATLARGATYRCSVVVVGAGRRHASAVEAVTVRVRDNDGTEVVRRAEVTLRRPGSAQER